MQLVIRLISIMAKSAETTHPPVDAAAITRAHDAIRPYVRLTPTLELRGSELGLPPCTIVLKLEMLQHAGSFKTRGAFANLLLREIPPAGVVAASGGNHGAAVAYAAMRLSVPARIFVPRVCSATKRDRIRRYGADLVVEGDLYADALRGSQTWAATTGALPIHAFDQHETLLGQGTIGLELSAQAERLDTLLVAVGGGGLIAGISAWYAGAIRMIGVEPENAPTLTTALAAGRPVDAPASSSGIAADSLAPSRVGELVFEVAQRFVDDVLLVTDDEIRNAQETLWREAQVVAEPGGATAFAALLAGRYVPAEGERVGVVISGANTTAVQFSI
jgi:threonine dehydratase